MKGKKLLAGFLSAAMAFGAASLSAFAEGGEIMTFNEFIEAVEAGGGTFDGAGKVVQWSPVSGCYQTGREHACTAGGIAAGANTPARVNSELAQYQIFRGISDINISNVTFEFTPGDFAICANSGWQGSYTSDQVPNAQLHLYNSGDVTLTGCTFDSVVVTPWKYSGAAADRTVSVSGCTFENIENSYGIKDCQADNISITGNRFINTKSGIMLSGGTADNVVIGQNTFELDTSKEGHIIQIAANYIFDESSSMAVSNNISNNDAPVFRIENADIKNVLFTDNTIPEGTPMTSDNSTYVAVLGSDGKVEAADRTELIWTTDSDAGFYYIGETKYGMMRFLFDADIDSPVTQVGIKYINAANIGENVTGENAAGAAVSKDGDIKTFYGDIVNIPDTVTDGTYYAAAYIVTDSGTIWSDIVDCSVNWTKQFTEYQPAGGVE